MDIIDFYYVISFPLVAVSLKCGLYDGIREIWYDIKSVEFEKRKKLFFFMDESEPHRLDIGIILAGRKLVVIVWLGTMFLYGRVAFMALQNVFGMLE